MKTWLKHIWSRLRTSLWFLPGAIVLFAIAMAYTAVLVDRNHVGEWLLENLGLAKASADGVRSLLSTAATAILTLAGLTFSATVVALTMASGQFGSRILRNFIRSVPSQVSLGILLGNFVFCLIVLRSVRSVDEGPFVPELAAFLAFLATLLSLATFIHFVHHIATSLQADNVVARIHQELDRALDHFFPDERPADSEERKAGEEKAEWETIEDETPIRSSKSGYINAVNLENLMSDCERLDLRCRVLHRPGQFVSEGTTLLALEVGEELGEEELGDIRSRILIGRIRTAEQDIEFSLRQLVEIALRALSPGINDPFTAIICIDYLGAALAKVATRRLPERTFPDSGGEPRVHIRPTTFGDLLDAAFHQIRQTAGDRPDIAIRLLESFERIAGNTMIDSHRKSVAVHAEAILAASSGEMQEGDRKAVQAAYDQVMRELGRDSQE